MKLAAKFLVLLAFVMTVQIFGQPASRFAHAEEEMNGSGTTTNGEEPATNGTMEGEIAQ